MKIKIHKGTNEIGGSCIEISTENTRIYLDYGTPLKKDSEKIKLTQHIDAILISHPHQDHFGEIVKIDSSIPIYCGELALELMNATKIFTGGNILENNFTHYESWENFVIGDFTITPYLVDHSAVDAHAFLIEADGKRVLYSGDFRANGRKSKLFDQMLKDKKLKDVDVLIMEGTMLHRSNDDFPTEQIVEEKIYQIIKETNQITFMIGSSQNIDSIVSAYRACKKTGKTFVVDMYTAWVLEKLKIVSNSIPNISWNDVKVVKKFGGNYYAKIKENPLFLNKFTDQVFHEDNLIEIEEIKNNPSKYFLKVSPWHIEKFMNYLELKNANIIYSQWLGYLKEEFSEPALVEIYKNLQLKYDFVYAHTSGHADLEALKKFSASINAKKLIPIHTEYKNEFLTHFNNVVILEDDEIFYVNNDALTKH